MGVKATSNTKSGSWFPFPKLMSHKNGEGTIVLFTSERVGTVLRQSSDGNPVGYYYSQWEPKYWEDFKGDLTLTNE